MSTYGRRTFELSKKVKDSKITLRESLQKVAKQTGKDLTKLLNLPEIETELLYIFDDYCMIKGSEPLTWTEIKHWSDLTGSNPNNFELECMMALDTEFYKIHYGN